MSIKTGTSALYNQVIKTNHTSDNTELLSSFDARVTFVLVDNSNKSKYIKYGGEQSIGLIECYPIISGAITKTMMIAFPISSNNRKYPIENEIVRIVKGSNSSNQTNSESSNQTYYYTDVVGSWNSVEHNSLPSEDFLKDDNKNDKISNYKKTENGIINNPVEKTVTGTKFKETGKVKNLIHHTGDMTYEGRFGTSIRLGGGEVNPDTPWKHEDSSPICIIRNKQKDTEHHSVYEDINLDGSSFYMLNGHEIDFVPSINNFASYNEKAVVSQNSNYIIPSETNNNITPENKNIEETISNNSITGSVEETKIPEYSISKPTIQEEDELEFLPSSEEDLDTETIFEDTEIRHNDDIEYNKRVNSIIVKESDYKQTFDINVTNDVKFLAYMRHQQGPGGVKDIVYYAKNNIDNIPRPSKYSGKSDIQGNMYNNSGPDIVKKYGRLTPKNFLNYQQAKFNSVYDSAQKSPSGKLIEGTLQKYCIRYNVPLDYAKTVAYYESGFKPSLQDISKKTGKPSQYKGLYQLSFDEFHKVYPGDNDIFNLDKNANVGIKLLSEHIKAARTLVNQI